jgi:hypothetical protein
MIPSKTDPNENLNAPIRLAVLIDDDSVPQYVNTLLDELSARPDLRLAAVIVHRHFNSQGSSGQDRNHARKPSSLVSLDRFAAKGALFFITAVEALMLRLRNRKSRPLRPESLKYQPTPIVRLTPLPAEVSSECNYSQSDLELLRELSLDYLVIESKWDPALAARTRAAKFGAIRMRFGELPAIPTRQAGFREVCRRDPSSKFRIMLLDGHGAAPIFAGAFHTRLSLVDNRNELIRKAYPYLGPAIVAHFTQSNSANPAHLDSVEPARETATECLLSSRDLFGSLWARIDLIRAGVLNVLLGRKGHWQIAWYRGCWPEVASAKSNVVESTAGSFLADPFVVKREGRRICYVEEYEYRNGRGVISALELTGTSARMLGSIIEEPFHLSFPFIFEFKSRLYMCPESAEAEQIRVYECVEYPLQWRLCRVLMDNVCAADTMLFEYDGRWWMFTNIDPQGTNDYESRLYLFWSDSPLSTEWEPHPQNPVIFDPLIGRNAGFVTRDDELFRCAQRQGFSQYGEAFSIRKITELTTERYAEQSHLAVGPEKFGAKGTHHIHHDDEFVVRDECHIIRPR